MSTAKRREGGVFGRIEYGTVPVAEMGFRSFVRVWSVCGVLAGCGF